RERRRRHRDPPRRRDPLPRDHGAARHPRGPTRTQVGGAAMSGASVLFDAPGPKARRRSVISSIVSGLLILAGLGWIALTLAAPRESGGITLPGYFDPSRWDVFADPAVWERIIFVGVAGT